MRNAHFRVLLLAGLLGLAGCASTPSITPVKAPPTPSAFTQAHQLAQSDVRGNAAQIEALLATLDDASLARHTTALAANDPLYALAGRAMLRRGLTPPHPFNRGPELGQRAAAAADGYRPPNALAVLLPLTGAMANAAKPVRDGLMAAYHAERRTRPPVRFYDTSAGVMAAYQRAVAEGADYVVGPLQRGEVDTLFAQGQLPVPVLALNRGERDTPESHIAFSLAPEDEGIAAAEWLIARQASRAVVILNPGDDALRRAANAFSERLHQRGGQVVETVRLGNAASHLNIATTAPVDAVYFAIRGEQARNLMAAINQHPALARAARIAAAQITSGMGNAEEASALDGIVFPGESLQTRSISGLPGNPGALTPSARGAAARLFAFGHDAWLITAYPERLSHPREGGLGGATGVLKLDGFGNITRSPDWSVLRGGVALPYSGR
ncbi:MAG: penicillin-binding protein activator [Pseudomonadota bacterium]|nr:penicillin-binding protein activator [Pseudomonadota bacterium]